MIKLHKLIATVGGIGYVGKGGGTLAAIAVCIIYLITPAGYLTDIRQIFFTLIIIILGIWSGNAVDSIWGKDSSKVVIDEFAGMMITLLFTPLSFTSIIIGLLLFRFFDIAKPLYIKKLENLPKGWGVMADDVLAGIYSLIILRLITFYHLI